MYKRHTFGALATGICLTATLGFAGCGGGGSHTASVAQFCKDNISLGSKLNVSETDLSGLSETEQVHKVLPALSKLTDEAPSAIKPDLEVMSKQLQYVSDGNVDKLDSDAFDTAYGHLDDFMQSKCHVSNQADAPFSTGSGSSASNTNSGNSSDSSASQYGAGTDSGSSSVDGTDPYASGSAGSGSDYGTNPSDGSSSDYGTNSSSGIGNDTSSPSVDPSTGSSSFCPDQSATSSC